ncbi:copper resistance protein B [Hydrocarboniphaga sp.]|uniref:copper resistance protein B n=1 Tax=Hydrocarboniphaga sp. TaxID=2033016 RepID=UPI002633B0F0|nr:copper resistance protein B [Hydrocarboniphaga sp.]
MLLASANVTAAAQDAMPGMEMPAKPTPQPLVSEPTPTPPMEPMPGMSAEAQAPAKPMEPMQGDTAAPDARDPEAYAEGYEYTGMPGMERTDRIAFGTLLADELEFLSGNEGEGYAWSLQGNYGDDRNKLWLRSQGLKLPGEIDPTTSAEVLWYRPTAAFWGTQLGLRQDFGAGAHTYLAAGIQGLAPYLFQIEATGYVGDDGRLSARIKLAYDMRLTNRLFMVPSIEANAYSEPENERGLGAGLGNVEGGLRLRYELHRKFAPYVGYVWERSFDGTADRRRAEGGSIDERRFVAGIRMWW